MQTARLDLVNYPHLLSGTRVFYVGSLTEHHGVYTITERNYRGDRGGLFDYHLVNKSGFSLRFVLRNSIVPLDTW